MSDTSAMDEDIRDSDYRQRISGADETVPQGLVANKAEGRTPGEMVREARLAREYSLDDLCGQTMLSRHTVEALEDNQYDQLSQPVFARGYYGKCARVLGMNVDTVMTAYAAAGGARHAPAPEAAASINVVPAEVTPDRGRPFGTVFLVLILLVVSFAVYLFWSGMAETPTVAAHESAGLDWVSEFGSTRASAGGSTEMASLAWALSGAGKASTEQPDHAASSTAAGTSDSGAVGQTAESDVSSAGAGTSGPRSIEGWVVATTTKTVEQAGQSATASGAGATTLTLEFDERSRVDVQDATGEQLPVGIYEHTTRTLAGVARYDAVIGYYAPGVEVRFVGEPVEFEVAANNTARFSVGRGGA